MGNNAIEKLYEIFFETFDFPMIQMQPQPLMSLYGHGLLTGIVVDSGKSHTDIVPVHDSKILYKNAFHSNFGGRDITQFIYNSFLYNFGRNYVAEMEICKKIKEKMCFISQDIKLERKIGNETTSYDNYYALEKGRKFKVSHQRYEAPEIMFTKQFDIERNSGIHKCIFDTIMKTDESLHDTFFKNIIITGNNTKFPGFASRLRKEMRNMVSMIFLGKRSNNNVEIIENTLNNYYDSYDGGCLVANISKNKEYNWISKGFYNELGAQRAIQYLNSFN